MGIFKKKNNKNNPEKPEINLVENVVEEQEEFDKKGKKIVTKETKKKLEKKGNKNVLEKGYRSFKDLIAPPSIDRTAEGHLRIGNKHVRSFVMNGFPSVIGIGWLQDFFDTQYDMDTALYIVPADERDALDELTKKITQFEAQLLTDMKKGNIRNQTMLEAKIQKLTEQRRMLEQNFENLFHIQIVSNLYVTDSDENLYDDGSSKKLASVTEMILSKTKARRINLSPMYLRQEESYKSALPFGECFVEDRFRNFNTGALTACFPFYNSDISHKNGVFIGINLSTNTPILIDFYDRSILNNSNASVFGQAGSGKTFFVSLLTLRSALKGIRTVIIDPEGEYRKITQAVKGAYIKLAQNTPACINPFDIEIEDELDENGELTGEKLINVKDKASDLVKMIAVMIGGMNPEQTSVISTLLVDLYHTDFEITEDPNSLYESGIDFDEESGQLIHGKVKKMPTLSNFYKKLNKYIEANPSDSLRQVYNSLTMFVKGGIYDLFDRETSEDLREFKNAPIVTFDVSKLEGGSILRPLGMYIAMSWTWNKFIKGGDLDIKKRIICDEAWMLVSDHMAGTEFTAEFLENAARRIRKRNGGLLVASQNFKEFASNDQGQAVLTNTVVNILLKQNSTDIDAVQEIFNLSDGESGFLLSAKKGQMLIKMNEESSISLAVPFQYEKDLIDNAVRVTSSTG